MSVALHGNLKDFGIAEVFQLIGQQRKTGLLEITGEDGRVQLAFDEGAVVWATPMGDTEFGVLGDRLVRCGLITRPKLTELINEGEASARALPTLLTSTGVVSPEDLDQINELLSRETIFNVMRWTGGQFHFKAQAIHHQVPPEKLLAAEQILMDGLRMLDEWQTFKALVPGDESVFEPIGQWEVYRQQATGDARHRSDAAARIFQLVDGRLTARRIIDLSRLGMFDATRILAELHSANMIRPLDPSAVSKLARPVQSRPPIMDRVRFALAAILPVLLLAALVQLSFNRGGSPADLAGVAVPGHPLADVRQAFERRRLRHAVETRWMISGEWPAELGNEPLNKPRKPFSLTPSDGEHYYYAQRDGGIVLLSPMR